MEDGSSEENEPYQQTNTIYRRYPATFDAGSIPPVALFPRQRENRIMTLPRMCTVRQKFPDRSIADVPGEARGALASAGFGASLAPGSSVAIGVGSRGISNIAAIVRAVADHWKSAGMRPFIFPAMGSHGAATAEGQARVLAHYGIDETTMGCPIVSSLDVVSLGRTADGIEAFMDRHAFESAGVTLVNRVKWHTDFSGQIESGLFKMMAIGLGKFAGAHRYHTYGVRLGLEHVIRSVGRQLLASGKILGGLAILEDGYHNTARLEAVPAASMEQREEELLELAKSWAGRIPVEEVDLLIVDEIGKNISGTGMDTKVINRSIEAHYNPFPNAARVRRIFARGMSELSYGNAVGIGLADIVTDRLVAKMDCQATYINSLTASTPSGIRVPLHFPTDRECIERILGTVGKLDISETTIGWIRNTLELSTLALSENLLPEIRRNPLLEVTGEPREMEFDPEGRLVALVESAEVGAH